MDDPTWRPTRTGTALWAAAAAFAWFAVFAGVAVALPAQKKRMGEFGLAPPAVTGHLFDATGGLPVGPAVVIALPVLAAAVAAGTFVVRHRVRSRTVARWWALCVVLLPTLLAGVVGLALMLGEMKLRQALAR